MIIIEVDGKEVYGIIYKITNTVNNKSYIGQTINKRGFRGRYYATGKNNADRVYKYLLQGKNSGRYYNSYLLHSLEKYGLEAFEITEVLDTAQSQEELNKKEIYYIQFYDSFNNGYNMNKGGEGSSGTDYMKGFDNPMSTPITQLSLDGKFIKEWGSFGEIRRSGLNVPNIEQVCNGKNTKAYESLWMYSKDYDPNKEYYWKPPSCYKTIILLDDNNQIIQEFHSLAECARMLHIDRRTARDSCKQRFENPKYKLRYKDEYIEEQRLNERTPALGDATV